MDIVTRAEFEHFMKDMLTKEDMLAALAGTRGEIASIKDKLDDIKVEILGATRRDLDDAKIEILATTRRDLDDAKIEILATTRRDLDDAKVEILATTRRDLEDAKVEILTTTRRDIAEAVDQGLLKNAARLDAMEHKINTVVMDGFSSLRETMTSFTAEMRGIVKHHEQRLDRHDADFHKLRQSGVLQ